MRTIRFIYKMQLLAVLSMVLMSSGCGSSSSNNTPADTTAPSVPTYLTAVAATDTRVSLRWLASTDNVGVGGYFIYRDSHLLASTQTATTFYSDTIGTADTVYTYTVAAYDAAGNVSALSSGATTTTYPAQSGDIAAPSAPTSLSASATSSSQISLSWTAPDNNIGVSGYNIYRATASLGSYSNVGTTTTTSYIDTGLTTGTRYYYVVKAFDGVPLESAASGETSATP